MKKLNTTLVAVVVFTPAKGKVKCVTHITITMAGIKVATATKGGRYSQDDALTEFRRNPNSFTKLEGWETAKGLKLVA